MAGPGPGGKPSRLDAGKLADLAVCSHDPLTVDETGLRDIVAKLTLVGGRIVHQRDG